MLFWLIILTIILSTAWVFWSQLLENKVTVGPNNRERVVATNVIIGNMYVLGPGTHLLLPGHKILARVQVNREPIEVPEEGETGGEEVRATDGIILLIEYRYDFIAGRPYVTQEEIDDPANHYTDDDLGILTVNPDDIKAVENEIVTQVVTRINYEERLDRIGRIVSAAVEEEIGNYSSAQLLKPGKIGNAPQIPLPNTPLTRIHGRGRVESKEVTTAAGVYRQLSLCIEYAANRRLSFVGINIVDFCITNLIPRDAQIQAAYERQTRMLQLSEAAQVIHDQETKLNSPSPLTNREAMVAGEDIYGQVTLAEAIRSAAQSLAEGMKNFGKGGS